MFFEEAIMDKGKQIFVDTIPYLCEGFSVTPKSYKFIDQIYNKHKFEFKEAAESSEHYNHPISKVGTVKQTHYYLKFLGIITSSLEETDNYVDYIFEKTFKYENTYIRNISSLNLTDYMMAFVRKNKGLDNLSDDEINTSVLVIYTLAQIKGIPVNTDDSTFQSMLDILYKREQSCRLPQGHLKKEHKKLIKEYELKIKKRFPSFFRPSGYVTPDDAIEGVSINISKLNEAQRFWGMIESVQDDESLSLSQCVGTDFLKDPEISKLIELYFLYNGTDDIDMDKMLKDMYPIVQLKYLAREYNKAREYFLDNHDEELEDEVKKLQSANIELQRDVVSQKATVDSLLVEISKLNQEIKHLKSLEFDEDSRTELNRLREYVYNLSAENEYRDFETNESTIIDAKGIIIGGHVNWQNKLSEKLPNFRFISADQLNVDPDLISNCEIVLFNTTYLNHSMYYKFIGALRRHGIAFDYVDSTNIYIALQQVKEAIKKHE